MPEDAVEALAGSLGKREVDPGDGKPAEDKVKVMAAQMLLEITTIDHPQSPNKCAKF